MVNLEKEVAEVRQRVDPNQALACNFQLINAGEIDTRPIEWIWPGMLARGKLHTLAGRGGMGKTTVMLKVAAIISRGGYFPDCSVGCEEGSVLYISGEDGAGDTIVPRFVASGGEPERLNLIRSLITADGQFLSIADHHLFLEQRTRSSGAVLVVFDPVTEFCGGNMDNNSATHVRSVLGRLQEIATATGTAVMCLTHLTKRRDGEKVDQVLGSGAWTHAPRIVWGVAEDESGKYLGLMKSNISVLDHVYPYSLFAQAVDGVEAFSASIGKRVPGEYLSNYTEIDSTNKGRKSVDAGEYLRNRLSKGPVEKQTLIKELETQGISASTTNRAAEQIGVLSDRAAKPHGPAIWRLPE